MIVSYILAIQLILTFFAPPFHVGERSIFLPDLWCWVWVAIGTVYVLNRDFRKSPASFGKTAIPFAVVGVAILLIYAHGAFRLSVTDAFRLHYSGVPSDVFLRTKELVVALRFISWIWAGFLVARFWRQTATTAATDVVAKILPVLAILSCVIAVLEKSSPAFAQFLAVFYRAGVTADNWVGRAHITFPSPPEAGIALAFTGLIILASGSLRSLRLTAAFSAFFAAAVTQTVSAFLALAVIASLTLAKVLNSHFSFSTRRRWFPALIVGVFAFIAIVGVGSASDIPFVKLKIGNFLYRIEPWRVFLRAIGARLDCLILGLGFLSYHVDNSYIWVLSRGGLLAFGGGFTWFVSILRRYWKMWKWSQKVLVLYLLLTGVSFDSVILRPIVYLLLSAAIPILIRNGQETQ